MCTAHQNAGKKHMSETKTKTKCRIKAPNAQACGYENWELVKQKAEEHPNLRPCPKHNWWWVDKKNCEKCKNKEEI